MEENNFKEKYTFTNEKKKVRQRTLHRIVATRDFGDVKKGDLGGWVEKKFNLSQLGECWIYGNAMAMGLSQVYDDAKMFDCACICDYAELHDNSTMYDYAELRDNAKMYGYSKMYGETVMCDESKMYDKSEMYHEATLSGDAILKNNQKLYGSLYTTPDNYLEIQNPQGKLITCVLKDEEILYNIGYKKEITKKQFLDRIYNRVGGIEKNPRAKEYLKIIEMSELYFGK